MGVDFMTIPNLFSDLSELFTEMTVACISLDVSKYSPLVDPDIFHSYPFYHTAGLDNYCAIGSGKV